MKSSQTNRGFTLVTALFVLVAFASIGAAMVSVLGTATQAVDLALLEARTYYAAALGLDYASMAAVNNCVCGRGGATLTDTITNVTALSNMNINVSVSCTSNLYEEEFRYHVYSITAIATHGTFGTPDYTARRITVTGTDTAATPPGCCSATRSVPCT